ncbi:MAG TPA: hypothetical protein VF485_06240 [Sphingomonas sp.]
MIPLLLMLADAPATTAIDAERAFAADAKTIGQWTAFRKWSTDDAVMFVPRPTNAHDFLKDRKDPAQAIDWWPTASYVSCDGKMAVNTGGWKRPDGSVGYFSTVWQRQPDGGWKWIVDGGDALQASRPRPVTPTVKRASCNGAPSGDSSVPSDTNLGAGLSADKTLGWMWSVRPDGSRRFVVGLWDGPDTRISTVIDDKIAAPAK